MVNLSFAVEVGVGVGAGAGEEDISDLDRCRRG